MANRIIERLKAVNPVCRLLHEHKLLCDSTQKMVVEKHQAFKEMKKEVKPC